MGVKNIASIFSDILFKPSIYGANDMVMWKLLTDLLSLMIREYKKIFSRKDFFDEEEKIHV